MNIKYLPPGSDEGYYTWPQGIITGTALLQIPIPRDAGDYYAHLVALHEMGHAAADSTLGITWHVFITNVVRYEAQANAIALMWVKPERYAEAYERCLAWLQTYVDSRDGGDAEGILNDAILDVQAIWTSRAR